MVITCLDPTSGVHSTLPPTPGDLPTAQEIMARASGENFTVASRLLGPQARDRLMAFYGYARLVDELGDSYEGDRLAALAWVRQLVTDRAGPAGTAQPPTVRSASANESRPSPYDLVILIERAVDAATASGAGTEPLLDLIQANVRDQAPAVRCADWADLMTYCRFSANPVGRLVLAAFDTLDRRRGALSDQVCSALQVVEHMQDLKEDALADRVYLPASDLAWAGSSAEEVIKVATHSQPAPTGIRAAVARQLGRARAQFVAGRELISLLSGSSRVAVAGFVAGGLATIDQIEAHGWDTLGHPNLRPSPGTTLVHCARLLGRTRP